MITFSFDDGRKDTYTKALKIMKQYGLVGTIHITTGFVDHTWQGEHEGSAASGAMTIEEVKACYKEGFEITSHGDQHVTEEEDLIRSIEKLNKWGVVDEFRIGFSRPHSKLSESDDALFQKLHLFYARRGRAEGCYRFDKKIAYVLQAITKSKYAFYLFNKPNSISMNKVNPYQLTSTVIKSHNTADQIIYFLKKIESDENWQIFMFHSVLDRGDAGYGKDAWYFDASEFEKLCKWLSGEKTRHVVTMGEGVSLCLQKNGQ